MAVRSVRLEGVAELERKLKALDKAVSGRAMTLALVAGGKVIEAEAKARAPVRSGTLRRSITTEPSAGAVPEVEVGTNLVYAPIQEFGGIVRAQSAPALVFQLPSGEWRRAQSVQIPARPYLRPAFDLRRVAAIDAVRRALAAQLRSLAS